EDILSSETDDSLWRVPVRVDTADHPEASAELVSERTGTIRVGVGRSGPGVWVKVNPEQTGFYRVKYDSEDLQRLIGPIQDGSLPAPDRLGIQSDAFALSRAGMISATDFLTIAEAYKNETSAPVCADLATNLGGVDVLLAENPSFRATRRSRDAFSSPSAPASDGTLAPAKGTWTRF
ncbi:MAG: ERAP1-like C-terminal domain-containing protein, partial [Chloroflexi bacterium]|nr:ERAP1-like C-terminal domain-containing protein [Chloroflexota bacterium]